MLSKERLIKPYQSASYHCDKIPQVVNLIRGKAYVSLQFQIKSLGAVAFGMRWSRTSFRQCTEEKAGHRMATGSKEEREKSHVTSPCQLMVQGSPGTLGQKRSNLIRFAFHAHGPS